MINTRKRWVKQDGWRGYAVPLHAVCGANNTGSWSDSPCPEDVCIRELKLAGSILRKNGIRFRRTWCSTSNVFCIHGYLVVPEEDIERAKILIQPIVAECRLLYIV